METRTFRAPTMIEALQAVQKELGSDALVVSMRETEAGLWHKPCCEIVAARPAIKALAEKSPRARAATPEARIEPKTGTAAIEPGLKESLAAVIREVSEKNPAPAAKPAVRSSQAAAGKAAPEKNAAPGAKAATRGGQAAAALTKMPRPFTPEVLSSRTSTRTWIVTDEDAREDSQPAIIEKPAPKPAVVREAAVKPAALPEPEMEETPALARLKTRLLNQGLDAELVERLNQACAGSLSPARLADAGFLASFIKKQLVANLRPAVKILGEGRKVVCLIGTSGAGKTSTCAKLAAHFALQEGLKVAWIEANTVRTGAIAEARMITESLGVDLHLVYGPEDLEDALINTQDADLVLMDTAGCNPRREASLVELGALITSLPRRMTLLVTAATTKEADLKQSLGAFKPFSLDGLVVTHMDETLTFGSIYNHTCQSKLPVAYYTSDPAAMNGLIAGDGEILVNALFNEGI